MSTTNINTNEPIKALTDFRKACYDMIYAVENPTLAKVVDNHHVPLDASIDEMLQRLAGWTEDITDDYNKALKGGR